jgi:hypothetical protein
MKRTIYCFLAMMMTVCAVFSADLGGNAMRKTLRPEANGIAITTSIPDTLYADTLYSIPLTATYTGNGTLVWTTIRQPSNMQEIADTLVWLPTLANVGNDTIIISVSDGSSSDTMTKPIVVRAQPAVGITTVFPDTFYVDSLYYLHLSARYSGSQTLTWTVIRKPSTMQDIANTLIWLPTSSNIGSDTIIISVSNGSESDTLKKPIVVEPRGGTKAGLAKHPEPNILSARVLHGIGSTDLVVGVPSAVSPQCEIRLFDPSGKMVYKTLLLGPGYHRVSLAFAGIGRGCYVVRVSNGPESITTMAVLR